MKARRAVASCFQGRCEPLRLKALRLAAIGKANHCDARVAGIRPFDLARCKLPQQRARHLACSVAIRCKTEKTKPDLAARGCWHQCKPAGHWLTAAAIEKSHQQVIYSAGSRWQPLAW